MASSSSKHRICPNCGYPEMQGVVCHICHSTGRWYPIEILTWMGVSLFVLLLLSAGVLAQFQTIMGIVENMANPDTVVLNSPTDLTTRVAIDSADDSTLLAPDLSSALALTLTSTPSAIAHSTATPTSTTYASRTPTATVAPTNTPTATRSPTSAPRATSRPTLTPTAMRRPSVTPSIEPFSRTVHVGYSVEGKPITATRIGRGNRHILLVGGIHAGFAPGGVALADRMVRYFSAKASEVPTDITLHVIPNLNPDSIHAPGQLRGRLNANGVDLNRNWDCNWREVGVWRDNEISGGDFPFSEPESSALRDYVLAIQPEAVVFWEARMEVGTVAPGLCSTESKVSTRLANIYGEAAGYQVEVWNYYTVNGDASNWMDDQGIPAVFVLLPQQYDNPDWTNNLRAVTALLHALGN